MDNNTELFQLLFYGKIVLKFLRKHHDLLHLLRKIHQILVLEILETRVILKQPDEKGLPIWNIYWLVPNEISFPFETKERKPFGKKNLMMEMRQQQLADELNDQKILMRMMICSRTKIYQKVFARTHFLLLYIWL